MAGIDGKWELKKAGGQGFKAGVIFEFENSKYHFRYGNVHNGAFKIDGNAIEVGMGMSTRMMSYE
jgi:hypothetical protein